MMLNPHIVVSWISFFKKKNWKEATRSNQTKMKQTKWNHSTVDQQLVGAMSDFFIPALIANSLQLQFLLQRFHLQPEILKKCQDEVEKVVGHCRLPTLNDRQKWIYIQFEHWNKENEQ